MKILSLLLFLSSICSAAPRWKTPAQLLGEMLGPLMPQYVAGAFTPIGGGGGSTSTVTMTGNCAGSANTCTLSASNSGDLIVVQAFRSASATAPTTGTGYTSVATATVGTASIRTACIISAGSGSLAIPTFTNANFIRAASYAGTLAITSANCNTTGIAIKATNSATTSTTADFPTFAPAYAQSPATSWIDAGLSVTAGTSCTPTGMTQFAASGTGPAINGMNTNGAVNTWADQTCTVTSGTWISYLTEIAGSNPALTYGGQYAIGASAGTGKNNLILFSPLLTGSDVNGYKVADLRAFFNVGGGNWQGAIYTDTTSGCGGSLTHCALNQVCADTTGQAVTAGIWNPDTNLTVSTCGTLTANTLYWIGQNDNTAAINPFEVAGGICNTSSGNQATIFYSVTYGTWGNLNQAGANAGNATNCTDMYVVLTPQ